MNRPKPLFLLAVLSLCGVCVSCGSTNSSTAPGIRANNPEAVPTVDAIKVISQNLNVSVRLPGELQPYEVVAVYPKVTAFVEWIGVDRGSLVKVGQQIARLTAPEITAQRAEAQSKLQSAEAQLAEAQAKFASDQGTYQKLKAAADTPGVVAGNDLEVSQRTVEADRARLRALRDAVEAARAALHAVEDIEGYLVLRAPFAGVVTERNVHPGALVGPTGGPGISAPIVRIEKISQLRLVVPVPEKYTTGARQGAKVSFTVAAFPNETFSGTIARTARSVDVKTRTMPVELDIANPRGRLAPGMYPEVNWPVRRPQATLFVPSSAIGRTTEGTFLIRVREGKVEWVNVQAGMASGGLVEVFGDIQAGDEVALRATDELRSGSLIKARLVPTPEP